MDDLEERADAMPCSARRLAEEFIGLYTPGRNSFTDTIEEAFEWLQDRSIPEAALIAQKDARIEELEERFKVLINRATMHRDRIEKLENALERAANALESGDDGAGLHREARKARAALSGGGEC